MDEFDIDPVDAKVMQDVERVGWTDIGVFPVPAKPTLPFNYTVGLSMTFEHPELLVMGIDNNTQHAILVSAVEHLKHGGRYEPNQYYDNVLVDYRVAFVEVLDPSSESFPLSMAVRLMGPVGALHLVWPDRHDNFPWHADFDKEFLDRQVLAGPWMGEE